MTLFKQWLRWMARLTGWAVLAGALYFAVALAPLVIVAVPCFMIFPGVPMVIAGAIKEKSLKTLILNVVAVYIYLPLMVAGLLGPFLAAVLLLEQYVPGMAGFVTAKYADTPVPNQDQMAAVLAAIAIVGLILVLVREAVWLARQLRLVENLPTSKIGSAALGLVEVAGVYRPGPDGPPEQRMHFWQAGLTHRFFIEDATGKILVDPQRPSTTRSLLTSLFHLELSEVTLSSGELKDGDPLYIIGTLEPNSERTDASGLDALILRRRSRPTTLFLDKWTDLRNSFLGGGEKTGSEQDLLFITDGSENTARLRVRSMRRHILLRGAGLVLLCLWLLLTRLDRLYPVDLAVRNPAYLAVNIPPEQRLLIQYCYHDDPGYRLYAVQHLIANPPPHRVSVILFFDLIQFDEKSFRATAGEFLTSHLQPTDVEFHPQLVALAACSDLERRRVGVQGLAAVKASWALAGPVLLRALSDPEVLLREDAAKALAAYAPVEHQALPALADALFDPADTVSFQAGQTLKAYGPAARPVLTQVFQSDQESAAVRAAFLLTQLGPAAEDLAAARKALTDSRSAIRAVILQMLTWRRLEGEQALAPELHLALQHSDPVTVDGAILAVLRLDWLELQPAEIPTILSAFQSNRYNIRQAAGKLAARTPALQPHLLPTLIQCAGHTDDGVACDAIDSLRPFGAAALPALPTLRTALSNPNRRRNAAETLGVIGPPAATPDILAALRAPTPDDSWFVGYAINARIDLHDISCLQEHITQPTTPYTSSVLNRLGESGAAAVWALPVLIERLRADPRSDSARGILNIMRNIGAPAREILPLVTELLATGQDSDPLFEYRAAQLALSAPAAPADLAARKRQPPLLEWRFADNALDRDRQYSPAQPVAADRFQTIDGQAAVFCAAGQPLTFTFDPPLDLSQGYTVVWRVKNKLIQPWNNVPFIDCDLGTLSVNQNAFQWCRFWNNKMSDTYSQNLTNADGWLHFALVYDPFRRCNELYVQGKKLYEQQSFRIGWNLIDNRRVWDDGCPVDRLARLQIGGDTKPEFTCWQGWIADLRIYNTPHDADQIAAAAAYEGSAAALPVPSTRSPETAP